MERVINCAGSAILAYGVDDDMDDSYSAPGQAAHAIGAECLTHNRDAWEFIGYEIGRLTGQIYEPGDRTLERLRALGQVVETVVVDKEMADAVQQYVDDFRLTEPDANQGNTWIERKFHCPSIHKYFYGTTDRAHIKVELRQLRVTDFKYGAGIVVEPEWNVQLLYYAVGMLEDLHLWDLIDEVVVRIVQPRAWHWESTIREWKIKVVDLRLWLRDVLIPAMDRALASRDTKAGEWCRFCPAAGRQCPAILAATEELERMIEELKLTEEGAAKKLTPEQADRFYRLSQIVGVAKKHVDRVIFGMLQAGVKLEDAKLVAARSNREWKDERVAKRELLKEFGDKAWKPQTLRSPAEIEQLPGGEKFVTRYAHKPDKGLTVAPAGDNRAAVNKDVKSMFKPVKPGKSK